MATRKEHEARAHEAFAKKNKHEAMAKTARDTPGLFDFHSPKATHERLAKEAEATAHKELAKAKRASE